MVKNDTTVAGVTTRPSSAYRPTEMNTSCTTAMSAPTAIFHSSRHAMNNASSTKNTTSALTACLVISLPHEGPTDCTPRNSPSLANSTPISEAFTGSFTADWMRSTSPPTIWILASASPNGRNTSRAAAMLTPGARTSHELPPSNSMPRFKCSTTMANTDTRIATPEIRRDLRH